MKITIGGKQAEPLSFATEPDEKLLHAALKHNLTVPYECATGTCGSCRAKLVSGELDHCWLDAPGRKALKVKRGEFLMCQSVALSDCEIRIPTPVAQQRDAVSGPDTLSGTIGDFDQLTGDVMSFRLSLDREAEFKAGQFMLLQLPGVRGTRAYSIVNYAERTTMLEFVIKKLDGGKCSEWLFDPPTGGADVNVFGPLGHAVFEPELKHDLLLLAGGSGIAGMMAILEHADQIDYLLQHSIELIFGVRSADDMFYVDRLQHLARKYPKKLRITLALSEEQALSEKENQSSDALEPNTSVAPENFFVVNGGFVHEHIAASRTGANTMAYIAGPPPMVDASIRELISACEFDVGRIRYDKFA